MSKRTKPSVKDALESLTPVVAPVAAPDVTEVAAPDDVLAEKIKEEHANVQRLLRTSLDHARNAGNYLALVAARMPYKAWVEWVKEKCSISEATANNYVRIHKRWHEVENEENYTAALKALRKKRKDTPEDTPEETPEQLSSWEQELQRRMNKYKVRGKVKDVVALLKSFGVEPPQ